MKKVDLQKLSILYQYLFFPTLDFHSPNIR